MLKVKPVGPEQADYHKGKCVDALTRYHTGGSQVVRRWQAGYADDLGLTGSAVTIEQLDRLYSAQNPATGETMRTLGQPRERFDSAGNKRHSRSRSAFDMSFNAPKSVSLLLASSDERVVKEVIAAHTSAVEAAQAAFLGEHVWARPKVQKAVQPTHVGRALRVDFLEFDTRAGDPHLHTHSVVANSVYCRGRWRTLDSRALNNAAKSGGMMYQAAIRSELSSRLGVRWHDPSPNGQADIEGFPPELLKGFAERASQIDEFVATVRDANEAAGEMSPKGKARLREVGALATRETKDASEPLDQATVRWRQEAATAGFDLVSIINESTSLGRVRREFNPEAIAVAAREILRTRYSSFRTSKATEAVLASLPADFADDAAQVSEIVERLSERVLDDPTVFIADQNRMATDNGRLIPSCHYTTRGIVEDEIAIVSAVIDGIGKEYSKLDHGSVLRMATKLLGDGEQARAVAGIASDGNQVSILNAPAGCGKTTLNRALVNAYQDAGSRVIGLGSSKVAAMELAKATGLETWCSTAKLLYEYDHKGGPRKDYRLRAGDVVIQDETSLLGTKDLARLTRLCRDTGVKLILQGDTQQVQAVDAGGVGSILARYCSIYTLNEVRRFSQPWEAQASLKLRSGDPSVVKEYSDQGRLFIGSEDELIDLIVERWDQARIRGLSYLAIAPTERIVQEINQQARSIRRAQGELNGADFRVCGDLAVAINDEIITRQNDPTLRTSNGESVCNGNRWRITGKRSDGSLDVESLENLGTATLTPEYIASPENIRLGYAVNHIGAQGVTVDGGAQIVTPGMTRSMVYVGGSRARDINEFFVVADSIDPAMSAEELLASAIERDDTDKSSVERIWEDALNRPFDEPRLGERAPRLTKRDRESLVLQIEEQRRTARQAAAVVDSLRKRTNALDQDRAAAAEELDALERQRTAKVAVLGDDQGGLFGRSAKRGQKKNLAENVARLDDQIRGANTRLNSISKEIDEVAERGDGALAEESRSTARADALDTRLRIEAAFGSTTGRTPQPPGLERTPTEGWKPGRGL